MKHLLTAVLAALSLVTLTQAAPLNLSFNALDKVGQALMFLNRPEVRSVLRLVGMERYLDYVPRTNGASQAAPQPASAPVREPVSAPVSPVRQPVTWKPGNQPVQAPVDQPVTILPIQSPAPTSDISDGAQKHNPPKRYGRHDNGKHLGWQIGKHNGWNRKSDDLNAGTDAGRTVADTRPAQQGR